MRILSRSLSLLALSCYLAGSLALPALASQQTSAMARPAASGYQQFVALRRAVENNILIDLTAMSHISGIAATSDSLSEQIRARFTAALESLELLYHDGKIDPFFGNLVSEGPARFIKERPDGLQRELRIGYFPVAADPLHWAHLLTALEAMVQLQLDKVVFIVAGRDERKPNLTDPELRHELAKKTLSYFGDLFVYSDVTLQEGHNHSEDPGKLSSNGINDGETNIFHELARNRHLPLTALYLVGSDHFNWTVEKGGKIHDDTLKKLEENMHKANLGFAASQGKHRLAAGFIARNANEINAEKLSAMKARISYDIQLVVPSLSYSSTQIRDFFKGKSSEGKQPLQYLPACAYQFIMDHGLFRK